MYFFSYDFLNECVGSIVHITKSSIIIAHLHLITLTFFNCGFISLNVTEKGIIVCGLFQFLN